MGPVNFACVGEKEREVDRCEIEFYSQDDAVQLGFVVSSVWSNTRGLHFVHTVPSLVRSNERYMQQLSSLLCSLSNPLSCSFTCSFVLFLTKVLKLKVTEVDVDNYCSHSSTVVFVASFQVSFASKYVTFVCLQHVNDPVLLSLCSGHTFIRLIQTLHYGRVMFYDVNKIFSFSGILFIAVLFYLYSPHRFFTQNMHSRTTVILLISSLETNLYCSRSTNMTLV